MLTRADDSESDPLLVQFLDFLVRDIAEHPQHIHALNTDLAEHMQSLVGSIEINLDSPLLEDDQDEED